jgi:hypothetical protein
MLLTIIWARGGGGCDTHFMTIFFELLNIVHENDFLNKFFKIILVPSSYFPLLSQFHYLSSLNDIQVNILIFGQQIRMYIYKFEFIYLPIMDEFHPMNYLFNLNHK